MRLNPPPRYSNQPLRLVYYAWLFGAFWANIVGGLALNRFARALGASDASFGLMSAIQNFGAVVQVPVSYLVERNGHRKRWFLVGGIIDRAMWVLIAAVPWVLPPCFWWQAFLICLVLAVVGANTDAPCWTSWIADLLPQRIRGRFITARSRLGLYLAILLPLPIGWLLDRCEVLGDFYVRLAASGLLAIAGLVGLVDILMHIRVPDADKPRPTAIPSLGRMMLQPLLDLNFRRFLGFYATLVFATAFLAQYIWLYCFDVLHMTKFKASLLLIIFPTMVQIFFSAIYGPLIDKLGRKPLIMVGAILILPGSVGWIFMSTPYWLPAYLLVLVSVAGWPAVESGRFNVLLSLGETRAGRGSGIAYVAIFSVVCALSGVLSGLFASAIVRALGPGWQGSLLGLTITYHGLLFILSTALRGLAILWLVRFQEPRAFATRDAIQYVASGTVSSLQQVVVLPFRFLRRIGATAYKIRPPW